MKTPISLLTTLLLISMSSLAIPHGPISGGGGGSLSPRVSIPVLIEHLAGARLDIESYLNGIVRDRAMHSGERWNPKKDPDREIQGRSYAKLLEGPNSALDILSQVQIEVQLSTPCFDFSGAEVDASIRSNLAYGICISLFRLQEKMNSFSYRAELSALLLHELFHLVGGDENEAVALQSEAFVQFARLYPYFEGSRVERFRSKDYLLKNYVSPLLLQLVKALNAQSDQSCALITDIEGHASHIELRFSTGEKYLQIASQRLTENFEQLQTQFSAWKDLLCKDPNYERHFGNHEEVTALDYTHPLHGAYNPFPLSAPRLIRKHSQPQEIINEILSSLPEIQAMYTYLSERKQTQYRFAIAERP